MHSKLILVTKLSQSQILVHPEPSVCVVQDCACDTQLHEQVS